MPYSRRRELPRTVLKALKSVPHAQEIYMEAYNSAWEEYKLSADRRSDTTREETAHAVAWSAVKHKYGKAKDGGWHPKE